MSKIYFVKFGSFIILMALVVAIFLAICYRRQYYHYYDLYMEVRIVNTIEIVEHAASADNKILDYLYADVVTVLSEATPMSLRYPQLASAKVSYVIPDKLMFHIAWMESLPSIDGICIHLPSESFITKLNSIPSENEYGQILYIHQQIVLETDPQWEKWLETIDRLKTQPIYVSLVRNKKVLKGKIELKCVPPPYIHSKELSEDTITQPEQ
jgi:hypothetical protein